MDPGIKLGPYEILEQLGAGGMGEVWLAQDTRLGRKVAIKVLPQEFSGDPERLARFEQEARAAAALNHPHIASVFDVGEQSDGEEPDAGSVRYMVQEFLEGKNLRELMQDRGQLPLKQSLQIGIEIAAGLRAAHGAGIVHRDLKPENVFVTHEGHAKILDFGLAKLAEGGAVSNQSATMSPTMLGTMAGQIMGTAGYMAPEQINGEDVDGRTDLFAFGCVLYELVTGERAFAGDNVHETLSRILSRDPVPVTEVRHGLPWTLGWIVDKALAKDPARRYQSAGDAVVDLERLVESLAAGGPVSGTEPSGAAAPTRGLPIALAGALGVALVAVAAVGTWWLTRAPELPAAPVQRFDFPITPAGSFSNLNNRPVAISPDGRRIAFVADGGDNVVAHLWTRPIDSLDVVRMRDSAEPRSPAFSPDGQEVAYWAEPGTLVRRPSADGAPVNVATLDARPYGITWGRDGNLWVGGGARGVLRVPATGGDLERVVALQDGEEAHGPRLLADGETVLFTLRRSRGRWDDADIVVWSEGMSEPRVLMSGGRDPRILPSGHLVYVTDNVLMARSIDLETLEVSGGAVALIDPLPTSGGDQMGSAFYDVSDTGTLVWTTGGAFARAVGLAWADIATGQLERLQLDTEPLAEWRLSPDGSRLAAERIARGGTPEVWIYDIERGAGQSLTDPGFETNFPVWSADGEWVYYLISVEGAPRIQRRRSDFSGVTEDVIDSEGRAFIRPADVSRDGNWLLYESFDEAAPDNRATIYRHALSGAGESESLVTADNVEDARFSPDGTLVAYSSMGANTWEVHVHDVASGARVLLSRLGSRYPTWSEDGSRVYYTNSGTEYAATLETDPRLRVVGSEPLFPQPLRAAGTQELSPDPGRVLVGVFEGGAETLATHRVFVTLNWFEELRQRVLPSR